MRGTIKWWDDKRGFGFIKVPGEQKDVFCHITAVRNGPPFDGDTVEFETEVNPRTNKTQACNVTLTGGGHGIS
jgi:cold shock CspA family protein